MQHLVIGQGEIGKAVHSLFPDAQTVDIEPKEVSLPVEVMHICIPYTDDFIKVVRRYQEAFQPEHTVIYSTVAIGTTKQIPKAVHSPVEGKHPDLEMSMRFMERWIGANDLEEALYISNMFSAIFIKTRMLNNSDFTEALKLLSTTEYGVNIEFARYKNDVAEAIGMDYELTKQWNQAYNKLYRNLGMEDRYQKYVLDAPEGSLGGHCVVENSVLLDESFPNSLVRVVYRYGKKITDDKPYLDRTWLYAEYWGKERSSEDIGREFECSGANILRIMRDRGIKRRTRKWTQSEIGTLTRLAPTHTFKEIAPEVGKTYSAVRMKAISLSLKSAYDPSKPSEETRKKISATLQGITIDEWERFTSTADDIIRRSDEYKEWRRAVFKRDGNTCQLCGDRSSTGRNIELHADHIKPFATHPELRFDISNGRVLCVECHRKTDTWGSKTRRRNYGI